MLRAAILIGSISLLALSAPAVSQQAAPTVHPQAQVDTRAVVADVRRILRENYVLPEVRPRLDAALAAGLASGRYATSDPQVLATRINADLTAVADDKHLGLAHDPAESARLTALPAGAGADDAPASEEDIRAAVRGNHGVAELRVLPGNLRYMRYNGFEWAGPKTAEAVDTAMRFLRDGDAAIIDLRGNGGGSPEAVQYLISHFMEANRPIVTFFMRGNPAEPLSTLPSLPAGRMVGKPLFVLTSDHTASAAEEFAGHVAGFKIGEVIGATTAGAGFRNEFFPVAGGYVISVSVGRAVLASTGKDWEGVGIAPTTKVDPDKALELAQARALRLLAAKASAKDKQMFEARATVLEAQVRPVSSALPLPQYAGTYGERTVTMENGALVFQRKGGPKRALVAVGPNEFAFIEDPATRVTFRAAGNAVVGFEIVRSDGSRVVEQRQPAG